MNREQSRDNWSFIGDRAVLVVCLVIAALLIIGALPGLFQ